MTKLALVELKLLTREPGAVFSLLIPLFILVVFGSSIEPGDTLLVPMALAIAVGLVGLYLLPTTLATYRERGILRRLSACCWGWEAPFSAPGCLPSVGWSR